jgi:hypothetical protein
VAEVHILMLADVGFEKAGMRRQWHQQIFRRALHRRHDVPRRSIIP